MTIASTFPRRHYESMTAPAQSPRRERLRPRLSRCRPRGDRARGAPEHLGGAADLLADPEVGADRQLVLAQQRAGRGRRPGRRGSCSRSWATQTRPAAPAQSRSGIATSRLRRRPSLGDQPGRLAAGGVGEETVDAADRRRRRSRRARSPTHPLASAREGAGAARRAQPSVWASSSSPAALAGSSSRRTTRSSSSGDSRGPRRPSPRGDGASARRRSRAPRCAGCGRGAPASVPAASMWARCWSIFAASSLDALAARRLGAQDRHPPAAGIVGEGEHAAHLAHHRFGHRVIGLVDDDDVGDLHHPRLQRLDRVAGAGHQRQDDRVGVIDDVDLGLADADGLDQDVVLAGRVHHQRHLQGGLREPAERAARGHRADEDAGVEEVVGEADAIAEQGAAGEGAGGVDREHRDLALGLAQLAVSAPIRVLLPTPGGPVKPTIRALPVRG